MVQTHFGFIATVPVEPHVKSYKCICLFKYKYMRKRAAIRIGAWSTEVKTARVLGFGRTWKGAIGNAKVMFLQRFDGKQHIKVEEMQVFRGGKNEHSTRT